jgi:hypothetical protein
MQKPVSLSRQSILAIKHWHIIMSTMIMALKRLRVYKDVGVDMLVYSY